MINARLVVAGLVAGGAAFLATPASAECTTQGRDIARVCYDYGVSPGVPGGTTAVTSAQAVCVPSANCAWIGRSGVTYNHTTGQICYAVVGNGWYCH